MNILKTFAVVIATSTAVCAVAQDEEFGQIGSWTFRAGYAWRAQAKTDFRGSAALAPGGVYANGFANGQVDWAGDEIGSLPAAMPPGSNLDGTDWSLQLTRGESVCNGSEESGMSGLKIGAGFDLYQWESVDFSALLDFAGYWGLENDTCGGYSRYTDSFRGLTVNSGTPSAAAGDMIDPVYAQRKYLAGGQYQKTRLRSDLYQVAIGPQVTWHALSWLDAYANVEAICNCIRSDLDVGCMTKSDTRCRAGFGGNVGIVGNITENIGIFGQVGYEWVDKNEVTVANISARTDYSSFVASVGIQIRF